MGLPRVTLAGALTLWAATVQPLQAGSMHLAWSPVAGASGYRLYYGTAPGQYENVVEVGHSAKAILTDLTDCERAYVAVKSYGPGGESGQFSNEISGWPRPEVWSLSPSTIGQGSRVVVSLRGTNFRLGARVKLLDAPTDAHGRALVRIESAATLSCHQIQAQLVVEPLAAGQRAMKVSKVSFAVEVRNPDTVFGSEPVPLSIYFDVGRWDIDRSEPSTLDSVDGDDLAALARSWGASEGGPRWAPDADLDGDGRIDGTDLAYLAQGFGQCRTGAGWLPCGSEP